MQIKACKWKRDCFHTCVSCLAEMIAVSAVWTWGILGNEVQSGATLQIMGGQRKTLRSAGWAYGPLPITPAEDKDAGRGVALSTVERHSGSAGKQLYRDVLSDLCIQVLNVTTSNFTCWF